MHLQELLQRAIQAHVSDLHLREGDPPLGRVHGVLNAINDASITEGQFALLLHSLLSEEQRDTLAQGHDVDAACSVGGERWRVHGYSQRRGRALSLRRIPSAPPALESLGLPQTVASWTSLRSGLVLITGPTGSGKSTTAASMVNLINSRDAKHIVTIENPIEFVHEMRRSLVSQREVGTHVDTFATALRSALREDPDIIFVGEMRDLETITLALQAAETGHLVISTLHTSSAAKTISRIVDVFPAEQQAHIRTVLADILEGVVAQELVANRHGGRSLVVEVLQATSAVRALIREGKMHHIEHVIQTGASFGMRSRQGSIRLLQEVGLLG